MLATHSGQLERWLGKDAVDNVSRHMRNWYGPPIAVGGVPGRVYAGGGGDFRGRILAGRGATALDHGEGGARRVASAARRTARNQATQLNAGFSSFSDLVAELSQGKRRDFRWNKVGATGVIQVTNSLWGLGPQPAAGANAAAAPGGEAPTDATTGAIPFTNPTGGDTQHIINGWANCEDLGNSLLVYDRIFQVNKTMNSTATEAVTGVPTRYQAGSGDDYSAGNFLFVEVGGTALAATAHNWTVCTYTDQDGNAGATLPSLVGNSGAIVRRLDHPVGQFFAPLATGDHGVRALTQMQCSAAVATGVINFVIGHPLFMIPLPLANTSCMVDGLNTAASLVRVFDDAALALLELMKLSTSATTYTVGLTTCAG